jgi:hypothetical protein
MEPKLSGWNMDEPKSQPVNTSAIPAANSTQLTQEQIDSLLASVTVKEAMRNQQAAGSDKRRSHHVLLIGIIISLIASVLLTLVVSSKLPR